MSKIYRQIPVSLLHQLFSTKSVTDLETIEKIVIIVSYPHVFWYCLNGMGDQKNAPKEILVTLFSCILMQLNKIWSPSS